jgi:capsid protein
MAERTMTEAQRAEEEKRAKKAGMSLDKWLAEKERERAAEAKAAAPEAPKPAKKPGFFQRLIERAEKPLK